MAEEKIPMMAAPSSCCSSKSSRAEEISSDIKEVVRKRYAEVAGGVNRVSTITGAPRSRETAQNMGYRSEDLRSIPDSTLSSFAGCGNPLAIEEMKEGEVVLDLGSSADLDCFLAAAKVGPRGKVIGLDMTREMLAKAEATRRELALNNVEFRMGEMEKMPVESSSVDVIVSNCVINLSPEKEKVFQEAYRVLKPGGEDDDLGYGAGERTSSRGKEGPSGLGFLHCRCGVGKRIPQDDGGCRISRHSSPLPHPSKASGERQNPVD